MIRRIILCAMATFLSCHLCFAQSAETVRRINLLQSQLTDFDNRYSDSIYTINTQLLAYLKKTLLLTPPASAGWDKLGKNVLNTVISDDKNLRIFFWDTRTGGTARTINVIAQYNCSGKIKVLVLNDADRQDEGTVCSGGVYENIVAYHTGSGKRVYLLRNTTICSSALGLTSVEAFTIDQSLHTIPFFKTTKSVLSKIQFEYDLSASVNSGKDVPAVHLRNQNKTLLIPVIQSDNSITRHFLVYQYNGEQLVFTGKE